MGRYPTSISRDSVDEILDRQIGTSQDDWSVYCDTTGPFTVIRLVRVLRYDWSVYCDTTGPCTVI